MNEYTFSDYAGYSEAEFMADSYFQEWVMQPDLEKDRFWKEFLDLYPGKRETVRDARFFLKKLRFREDYPDEAAVSKNFLRHLASIERTPETVVVPIRTGASWWLKIAAFVGGIVLLGSLLLLFSREHRLEEISIDTQFGEVKSILLPDSSQIVLNAGSRIAYQSEWNSDGPREVWLDGEAFFDIKHINQDRENIRNRERFLVHTKELMIEVLGTSFNIRQRRGKTEVVLQDGQVKVTFKDSTLAPILLKPGDLVVYHPEEQRIDQSTIEAEAYTAWTKQQLILEDPSLEQITQYLEDTYGKKIVIKDSKLGKRKIEGPILLNDLDDALFVISTVLNAKVERKDSSIIIRPR